MEQLNISANHIQLDAPTTAFAEKKLRKIVKLLPASGQINLTFTLENKLCRVEAHASMPGKDIHAQATEDDFYISIKEVAEKLFRQLTDV